VGDLDHHVEAVEAAQRVRESLRTVAVECGLHALHRAKYGEERRNVRGLDRFHLRHEGAAHVFEHASPGDGRRDVGEVRLLAAVGLA
jgi:hypothetical protein